MKKRVAKKLLSIVLALIMIVQVISVCSTVVSAATTSGSVEYTDSFDYDIFDREKALWTAEYKKSSPSSCQKYYDFGTPTVENGVIYLDKAESAELQWTNIPNIATSGTYTIKFDLKVTDFGNGKVFCPDKANYVREFYVGIGGWLDQIYLQKDSTIFVGKQTLSDTSAYTLNTVYSFEIVWDNVNGTVKSTMKNGDTTILSGTRTSEDYKGINDYTKSWVFRCCDGAIQISNFSFTDGTVTYAPISGGWSAETNIGSTYTGTAPKVENGVAKMVTGNSIKFDWTKLIDKSAYNANTEYIYEFDFKVTNEGNGTGNSSGMTRALYVAPGGYYNQIEFITGNSNIRTGESYKTYDSATMFNTTLHAKLVWKGTTITSTITREDGTVVNTGSRTSANYAKATTDKYMTSLVLRCEDGGVDISNFTFTAGNVFYAPIVFKNSGMITSGAWSAEVPTGSNKNTGNPATVQDGKAKLSSGDSIQFYWTEIMDKSDYSADDEMTYEFDFKVTNEGAEDKASKRALYVAPGGYYNQLEFIEYQNGKNQVRAGGTWIDYANSMLNTTYHAKLVWKGTTITTTVTKPDGTVLVTGYRTSGDYNPSNVHMPSLVLRCEDGAVEIDNFKFYIPSDPVSTTEVSIPNGQQAVYECDITYGGTDVTVNHGLTELFAISDSGLRLCGSVTKGNYGRGTYHVKATINPVNKITVVELTLPNGGTVRRGSYATLTDADAVYVYSADTACVSNAKIEYKNATADAYTLNSTEPVYEGFNANVYNLVTSFTDAEKDRAFAWTAQASFVGSNTMAVRYRVEGTTEWTVVDAVKETEPHTVADEDYFKADISGLTANAIYEYQIGIKDSETDWSKTYTFKTAAENIDEFSFIALGDTQGNSWNGSTRGNKGFMYAQAAFNQAFNKVNDPAFILHTGDVVETGYETAQWNQYFKALGEYGATTPHFATIGNHDCHGTNNNVPFDFHFNHPDNGGTKAFDSEILQGLTGNRAKNLKNYLDETVYSFNYGDAHFVVLMSGDYNSSTSDDEIFIKAQRAWLEADLKANADAKWTVVMVHAPFYHRTGEAESRGWLADVVESNGVDLVIQGHSHLVTRTYPMKNGEIVTKTNPDLIKKGTGTVYTTIGSTTYNHDSIGNPNVEECITVISPYDAIPTYTEVKIDGDKIVMTVRQIDGLVLDSFTIEDRPEVVVEGFQTKDAVIENRADARFVATLRGDYKDLETLGFEFTYGGKTVSVDCNHVYTSIIAAEKTLTPDSFGGDYFFCYTLKNMKAGEYEIAVRPYTQKRGGAERIYGDTVTKSFTVNEDGSVEVGKSIDIYLIAGQSNASGSTKVTNAAAAYEWAPELEIGYANVHYAGNSRSKTADRDLPWQNVTLGLGSTDSSYIGPEAGMAEALSNYYNAETGKTAGIIKYAVGGSSLLNKTSGDPHSYGNWVSPSYAEHLGVSYTDSGATGKLYRNFLAQVEKNIAELYEYGGYTEINIKGLYWMQGCNNRTEPAEYQVAFEYFADDVRADLSDLMKEFTGSSDDLGASEMSIIVGTISQTQNLTDESIEENVNKPFVEMQKGLADVIENCYVVDNSQYAITRWNTNTGSADILGSDQWHWNQADALEIGYNVGELIVNEILTENN